MKKDRTKSKRKDLKIRPLFLSLGIITTIIIIIFFWNLVFNDTGKNAIGGISVRSALDQGQVSFISPDRSQKETILVEIAEDDYSRANGLMFREDLPENQGMLFIFEEEKHQYFWMKNTPVALDMIFVNKANKVVNIQKYTVPYSTRSYASESPALYVIEVVAGYSDKYGIEKGWLIEWKRF